MTKFRFLGAFLFLLLQPSFEIPLTKFEVSPCGFLPPTQEQEKGQSVLVPWNAAVFLRTNSSKLKTPNISYAGILVSPTLVFVSASLFLEKLTFQLYTYRTEDYLVSLGTDLFTNPENDGRKNAITSGITHIRIHPSFKPGFWAETEHRFALLHLSKPINISERVQPVCLPDSKQVSLIPQLITPSDNPEEEEILLTGWRRRSRETTEYYSHKLKLPGKEKCNLLWETGGQTNGFTFPFPYVRRWCGVIGKSNPENRKCINYDVGALREIDGKQYFAGIVNNLYSFNLTGICRPNRCGPQKFTCSNGDCINLSKVCDKRNDCTDASDENPMYCKSLCYEGEFACGIDHCLPNEQFTAKCVPDDDFGGTRVRPYVWALIVASILCVLVASGIAVICSKRLKNLQDEMRNLSSLEESEFLSGFDISNFGTGEPGRPLEIILSTPWDKSKEIPRNLIEIGHELQRGHFGIVCKAKLFDKRGKFRCDAAIKMPIPSIRVTEFKALLDELKVFASIGSHPHVVGFFGACEALLVLEYCSNGSILDYLTKHRPSFNCDSLEEVLVQCFNNPGYSFIKSQNFNVTTLFVWATQAAAGLEFLASKKIIHRDIAARNLLLSSTMRVKVSDFSLSRQLHESDVYAATQNEVPWKWLAPEALQTKPCYSEKTDIWAFGVTLWEIFSLGEVPYEERQWDTAFLQDITNNGLRLEQTLHCSDALYEVMQKCWDQEPTKRPSFTELKTFLSEMTQGSSKGANNGGNEANNDIRIVDDYFKPMEAN